MIKKYTLEVQNIFHMKSWLKAHKIHYLGSTANWVLVVEAYSFESLQQLML